MVMTNRTFTDHSSRTAPTPLPAVRPGIPGALREWILGRDSYRCRAPGCGRAEGVEVHLVDHNAPGGHINPANLITICPVCRPLWDLMGRGTFQTTAHDMVEMSVATSA
jgi:hypothetical protein|nr:HNH endonuclease signature motif containing protein [Candidatus Krumholzibacteria bacterium]